MAPPGCGRGAPCGQRPRGDECAWTAAGRVSAAAAAAAAANGDGDGGGGGGGGDVNGGGDGGGGGGGIAVIGRCYRKCATLRSDGRQLEPRDNGAGPGVEAPRAAGHTTTHSLDCGVVGDLDGSSV